ncbi:MAG: CCA tRNA nucleotidyltransferase [Acidilobus sp.]
MGCPDRTELEERALDEIRPTGVQLRALSRVYHLIRSALDANLSSKGLNYIIEPEGSYAKGTLLRDRWELDVFVLFKGVDEEWVRSESVRHVREALSRLPTVAKYSEHPYLTVSLMGIEVDVVPTLYSETPSARLGVARTPFHTRYVRSRLNACQADDVRLLKSFLRGINAYGAEIQVGGFSGYLAELLVLSYGSFRAALKAMSEWRPHVYLDPEGKGSREELEGKYPDSSIIIVDPIDPGRNAAAAVSEEKLALAVLAAKLYLIRPSLSFFHVFRKNVELKEKPPLILVLCRGEYFDEPPENVWGRLARASRGIHGELKRKGFTPLKVSFFTDEGTLVVVGVSLAFERLTGLEVLRGPDAWADPNNIRAFITKRLEEGGIWASDRLYGFRQWRVTEASSVVEEWLLRYGRDLGQSCYVIMLRGYSDLTRLPRPVRDWAWMEFFTVPSWLAGL